MLKDRDNIPAYEAMESMRNCLAILSKDCAEQGLLCKEEIEVLRCATLIMHKLYTISIPRNTKKEN